MGERGAPLPAGPGRRAALGVARDEGRKATRRAAVHRPNAVGHERSAALGAGPLLAQRRFQIPLEHQPNAIVSGLLSW
jgi:hypothetical protein